MKILPNSNQSLKRLCSLASLAKQPIVAVFGKYNHGKSTLLNAITGRNEFKTADKRETTSNQYLDHENVIWIDTPGLDADVDGKDDEKALATAFEEADILCIVHNVKAGELDNSEMKISRRLVRQDPNYRRKMVMVLTQIDQVQPRELEEVITKINIQLPDIHIIPVSAHRYIRGQKESKASFIKASGFAELISYLEDLKCHVNDIRKTESSALVRKIRHELNQSIDHSERMYATSVHTHKKLQSTFLNELGIARDKVKDRRAQLFSEGEL